MYSKCCGKSWQSVIDEIKHNAIDERTLENAFEAARMCKLAYRFEIFNTQQLVDVFKDENLDPKDYIEWHLSRSSVSDDPLYEDEEDWPVGFVGNVEVVHSKYAKSRHDVSESEDEEMSDEEESLPSSDESESEDSSDDMDFNYVRRPWDPDNDETTCAA